MKKITKMILCIGLIALVVYNAVLFVIAGFSGLSASFWVSYAFMMVGGIGALATMVIMFAPEVTMRDWFLRYPIVRRLFLYVGLEFVLSTLFMILGGLLTWIVAFAVQLILLGIFTVMVVSAFYAKGMVEDVTKEVKVKTATMKLLTVDAQMLPELCQDAAAKKTFADFAEAVRFSDPMSSDLLAPLEAEIQSRVTNAKVYLQSGDVEEALRLCKQADALLKERNLKCKALK